jgi:lysophospholipase L1-like esterase
MVIALAAASALALSGCSQPAGPAATAARTGPGPGLLPGPSYYLSLGDSLSQGVQPGLRGSSTPTDQGYPDQLYASLHRGTPGLRLVKLGCSGETTRTMIKGGICHYPAGSQLDEAVRFLHSHRGHVALITIDIGANDPNSCIEHPTILHVLGCMHDKVGQTQADLRTIMSRLRAAAGKSVTIIGMSYYVPELAGWLHGLGGKEVAVLTERVAAAYNALLTRIYRHYGAKLAGVFAAFHSRDFGNRVFVAPFGQLPRNVATICTLTWACASPPVGPNEHANDEGYGVIARAFLAADRHELS